MVCNNDGASLSGEDLFFKTLHFAASTFINSLVIAAESAATAMKEEKENGNGNENGNPKQNVRAPLDNFSARLQQQFRDVITARKRLWEFGYNNIGTSSRPPALAKLAKVHDLSQGNICTMVKEDNVGSVIDNLLANVLGSYPYLNKGDFGSIVDAVSTIVAQDESNGIFQQYQINQQLIMDKTNQSTYDFVNFQGYVVYMKYTDNNQQRYVAITPVILGYYAVLQAQEKDNTVVSGSFEPLSLIIIVTGMTVIGIIQAIKSKKAKISADLSKFKFDIEINQKVVSSHHGSLDMGLEVDVVCSIGFASDKQAIALELTAALTKEDVFGGHQFTVKF